MRNYARDNGPSKRGLHFIYVTQTPIDASKVHIGDVIFTDWDGDGALDHTMMVTNVGPESGERGVYATSQNLAFRDSPLSYLTAYYGGLTRYQIYRPTDYSPTGI